MNLFWPRYSDQGFRDVHGAAAKRGEQCHSTKLTARQVIEIRKLYANFGMKRSRDLSQRALAKRYNIHQVQVSRIVRRVDWRAL